MDTFTIEKRQKRDLYFIFVCMRLENIINMQYSKSLFERLLWTQNKMFGGKLPYIQTNTKVYISRCLSHNRFNHKLNLLGKTNTSTFHWVKHSVKKCFRQQLLKSVWEIHCPTVSWVILGSLLCRVVICPLACQLISWALLFLNAKDSVQCYHLEKENGAKGSINKDSSQHQVIMFYMGKKGFDKAIVESSFFPPLIKDG